MPKRRRRMNGAGIFDDVIGTIGKVARVAKPILRAIPDPRTQAGANLLDAFGAGRRKRVGKAKRPKRIMAGGAKKRILY